MSFVEKILNERLEALKERYEYKKNSAEELKKHSEEEYGEAIKTLEAIMEIEKELKNR